MKAGLLCVVQTKLSAEAVLLNVPLGLYSLTTSYKLQFDYMSIQIQHNSEPKA